MSRPSSSVTSHAGENSARTSSSLTENGGPALLVLRIFQRDQQAAGARRQPGVQRVGIAAAQLRRQRDQRGAAVDMVAVGERAGLDLEHIGFEDVDGTRAMQPSGRCVDRVIAHALFGEERRDAFRRDLDAQHLVSLRGEPGHVECLAAERHHHARAG